MDYEFIIKWDFRLISKTNENKKETNGNRNELNFFVLKRQLYSFTV